MKRFVCVILLLLVPVIGLAQTVHIDTSQLLPNEAESLQQIRRNIVDREMRAQAAEEAMKPPAPPPDPMEEYVTMGQGIAKTISEASKALDMSVEQFVSSPTGGTITNLITYKMVREDLFAIGGMMLLTALIIPIWLWSYYTHFTSERVEDIPAGDVRYVRAFSAVVHVVVIAVLILAWLIAIF